MCEPGEWKGIVNMFLVMNTIDYVEEDQFQEPREEEIQVEINVNGFLDED